MAKSYEVLKEEANTIKDEVEVGKNTATRVGTMFGDVVEKIEDVEKTFTEDLQELQEQITDNVLAINKKQDNLVSGNNIKTINGVSVLGSGNLSTSFDVAALFTVGGTLTAEEAGGDLNRLLSIPLYVRTDIYYSSVHVSVSNRTWFFVAHRIGYTDGVMYRVQRVAECTAQDGIMTCNNIVEYAE